MGADFVVLTLLESYLNEKQIHSSYTVTFAQEN